MHEAPVGDITLTCWTGFRQTTILRLDNLALPGFIVACRTPSGTETTHACIEEMYASAAIRIPYKAMEGSNTVIDKTLY